MEIILRVAGVTFLILAGLGFFRDLPTTPLTAAFYGLALLGLGELLTRLGKPK